MHLGALQRHHSQLPPLLGPVVSGYQHTPASIEELHYRVERALAEAEQPERDLAQCQELERALPRLKRRKEQLAETKERARLDRGILRLPEPIHGGYAGLLAATAEIAAWNARHRKDAA